MPLATPSLRRTAAALATLVAALAIASTATAATTPVQISHDPYTSAVPGQHATEVEPDSSSFGSRIVAAFQVGRIIDGGAANVGLATSQDAGKTWTDGVLPGLTAAEGGPHARVTDPVVAYDRAHGAWLVASVALDNGSPPRGEAVVVNRSTDGGLTWGNPVTVAAAAGSSDYDKEWIVCDNTPASPHYGNCYVQWDDVGNAAHILMSTSSDGGLTWGPAKTTADTAQGLGGQPVVQPNGTVIVPYVGPYEEVVRAFRSTDGGQGWGPSRRIAPVYFEPVSGDVRSGPLPSADIDGSGRVYVTWQDCRFRSSCTANDIVLATSTDGLNWRGPSRIPLAAAASDADHFVPGLGVDPATSGAHAHLGLVYHYMPSNVCDQGTCRLRVGFVSSLDGGASWSAPTRLGWTMTPTWLPPTSEGYMTGDYISTSFAAGKPHPVFVLARESTGATQFHEAVFAADPPLRGAPPPPKARALTGLRIQPRRFRSARRPVARVSYAASAAGATHVTLRRRVRGRWIHARAFDRHDRAGANRFRLPRRVRHLKPGSYRLVARPRDSGRPAAKPLYIRFRVLRPHHGR